jgi:hypothetical protein
MIFFFFFSNIRQLPHFCLTLSTHASHTYTTYTSRQAAFFLWKRCAQSQLMTSFAWRNYDVTGDLKRRVALSNTHSYGQRAKPTARLRLCQSASSMRAHFGWICCLRALSCRCERQRAMAKAKGWQLARCIPTRMRTALASPTSLRVTACRQRI